MSNIKILGLKRGGLLERLIKPLSTEGVCTSCDNLIKLSDTALGCIAHDKLIMPEYMPYHGEYGLKCQDWRAR